jgi:hypothetical protein
MLTGINDDDDASGGAENLRDARIRRLAIEALLSASAIDEPLVVHAATDPDPQVRRLAMRASAASGKGTGILARGLQDPAAMVRLDALRGFAVRRDDGACGTFVAATNDVEPHVALTAFDQLAVCGGYEPALELLTQTVKRPFGRRGAALAGIAPRTRSSPWPAPRRIAPARRPARLPRRPGGSCPSTPLGQRPRCASASCSARSPATSTTSSSKRRSRALEDRGAR